MSATLPVTDDTEASLCAKAAAGDRVAFSELVCRHENRVRSFLGHLGGADQAEEFSQEAFLKAWLSMPRYRSEAQFSSWVCAIAWRCFIDGKRREVSEARKRENFQLQASTEADFHIDGDLDLKHALSHLDPDKRAALVLCDGHGWSHGDAARIMGVPIGTLKSWVKRGKEQCRALLDGEVT